MRTIITALALSVSALASAQLYKDASAPAADRVEDLLGRMTLEEKIDYIGGYNDFYIRAIPRLDVPEIKLTDGPVGTHKDGRSTAYPAGVLSAATWNRDLVYSLGRELGRDSRARGVHILLGPGVNILRAPMCGRNFEYFTEDPYLNAETACAYVRGVQDQGVVATLKHFAANNQEWDRNNVSSDIDERTLHEIYFPAFKAAIQKAGAGSVMDSYNPVNGVHATQNSYLNNRVLREMWGFDGVVMSDWSATYDAVEAANGGLDLEMPRGKWMNTKNLLPAIAEGKVSESTIDEKVRRILSLMFTNGFYDRPQLDSSVPMDNPAGAAVALNLAREGIVLLKNEGGLLPVKPSVKRIALIGPNAASYISGGGSSYTFPFHSVSLLEGLRTLADGSDIEIVYSPGLPTLPETVAQSVFYTAPGSSERGLKGEYYNNVKLQGSPEYTRIDTIVNIPNGYHIAAERRGLPYDHSSMRWTGVVRPEKTARYRFVVRGFDGFRLKVDGEQVINEWRNQGITLKEVVLPLEAGKEYPVELEYFAAVHPVDISFGWREDRMLFDEAAELAASADIALVSIGFNESLERESNDRPFELPEHQDSLVSRVLAANPNTAVLMNAGSNVDMSRWVDSVPALLYLWYPGQEGGTAAAEIIFGKVNPSGKLPVTFEKRWEDNPAYEWYYDADGDKRVTYGEGLMVGYRHYDTNGVEPRFAFGFGKSYTTFAYSDLKVKRQGKGEPNFCVSFKVKNTGSRPGMETAQIYIRPIDAKVVRPYKELKAYDKKMIAPGKSELYEVTLSPEAFSYFKPELQDFGYDSGEYEILVGSSSDNILLRAKVKI
ncbi:MAG: glycoside hydrolase family 3 C-terminal domain-containing protein [Muribaculaceae bacterium]|nr:glycoside hydrolase family 3 C-terminal domain-containing protein [Muribaculaceae bacterium]